MVEMSQYTQTTQVFENSKRNKGGIFLFIITISMFVPVKIDLLNLRLIVTLCFAQIYIYEPLLWELSDPHFQPIYKASG